MTEERKKKQLPPGHYTACGGRIQEPERYPSSIYRGRKVYFCNPACQRAFEADPDRFMAGGVEHPLEGK